MINARAPMLYIRVASKRDAGTDPASYFDRLIGFDHNDPKGEKADRVSFFWYESWCVFVCVINEFVLPYESLSFMHATVY